MHDMYRMHGIYGMPLGNYSYQTEKHNTCVLIKQYGVQYYVCYTSMLVQNNKNIPLLYTLMCDDCM